MTNTYAACSLFFAFAFSSAPEYSLAQAESLLQAKDVVSSAVSNPATYSATAVYPPNPTYSNDQLDKIAPYRGNYRVTTTQATPAGRFAAPFTPDMGIQVDMGAITKTGGANTFVTIYSSLRGISSWGVIQGTYQPANEVTRWTTGVIGTLSGPIYKTSSGICLKCAINDTGAPASATETATLTWINSRELVMTIGSEQWDFVAPNMDSGSDGDYLVGRWAIHIIQKFDGGAGGAGVDAGTFLHDGPATIDIAPVPGTLNVSSNSAPGLTNYKPGDQLYAWTCMEELSIVYPTPNPLCDESFGNINFGNVNNIVTFWFDKATNRLGADVVIGGFIGPANNHIDLYVEGPDLIIGRGITEGTSTGGYGLMNYGLGRDGAMNIEIILQRLPPDTYGANLPAH